MLAGIGRDGSACCGVAGGLGEMRENPLVNLRIEDGGDEQPPAALPLAIDM